MLSLRRPQDPALAPDGRRLVFSVRSADLEKSRFVSQVYLGEALPSSSAGDSTRRRSVRNSDLTWTVRQLTFAAEGAGRPAWSPDGKWVAFESARKSTNQRSSLRQVYVMDLRGGEPRAVTEAREGVERWTWCLDPKPFGKGQRPHDRPRPAIVFSTRAVRTAPERMAEEQSRDRRFDARVIHRDLPAIEFWIRPVTESGLNDSKEEARRIAEVDPGVAAFDITHDGRMIVYTSNRSGIPADSDRFDLFTLDVLTGRIRQITSRRGCERDPRFSPDGSWISFQATADPEVSYSRNDLWVVPVTGGEAHNLSQRLDRDVAEVCWLGDNQTLLAVCQYNTATRLVRFSLDREPRIVHEADEVLSDLAVSQDGEALAVVAEGSARPPEIWHSDAPGGSASRVTDLNPQVARWILPERRLVRWKNEGFTHEGIVCLPRKRQGRVPLIMHIHGGPHGRAADTLSLSNTPAWCAEGYACFIPNYRGSSGYSNRYGMANREDLGGGDYRDLMTGLDHVLSSFDVDDSRLCVMGGSYGGYLTNWIIGHTDRFRAAASLFGIFSLYTDFSNSINPNWDPGYLGRYWWEDFERYHRHSPASRVEHMKTPVLLLHGDEDQNTFIANSQEMYQALRLLGRTVEFVRYPREGHGFVELGHQIDVFRRTSRWFAFHARGARPECTRGEGVAVEANGRELTVANRRSRRNYAGVKPAGQWLELTLVVRPKGGEREMSYRLSDFSLRVSGAARSASGVAVRVLGEHLLMRGPIRVAVGESDGEKHALALAVVFDVPRVGGPGVLRVKGFPEVPLTVPRKDGGD